MTGSAIDDQFFLRAGYLKVLILCLLFLSVLSAAQVAKGQNITIKQDRVSIKSVFKSIEEQTPYVFFLKNNDLDDVTVSVNFKNIPLRTVLSKLLTSRGFTYQIFGKTIAVKKMDKEGVQDTTRRGTSAFSLHGSIHGVVYDENELPLKGVKVSIQGADSYITSGDNGKFSLPVIDSTGMIFFSASGFLKQAVNYTDTSYLKVIMKKGKEETVILSEVSIHSANDAKTNPNKFVDLTNRSYMSLAQVLQGTVPGLSLQVNTSSAKVVTSVDVYKQFVNGQPYQGVIRMTVDEFLADQGSERGQQIIDLLLSGRNVPRNISDFFHINTVTTTTSTLVPQVRGSNSFAGSTAGMLVVIDGFPQDGFPANYPMTNVETIEVVKDPRELVKWGSRANNGLIIIKTKAARKGQLQVNYSANFYFEPASKFDRKKLRLASTADYLNYVKAIDSVFSPNYTDLTYYVTPAQRLFARRRLGLISNDAYTRGFDSLSRLDNQQQLNLLQQDRYSQNQTFNISGGTNVYKFNFLTNYLTDRSHDLGGYNKTITLNLNNSFNLLNKRLRINWLINYTNGLSRTGFSFSPSSVTEPYQLLLDSKGRYVYDYSGNFSPYADSVIRSKGYLNNGVNLLEDARANKNISRLDQKRTSLNFSWDVIPGLNWSTSLYYDGQQRSTASVYGKQSSYARQLVNTYGEYHDSGVNFYVPWGDVLQPGNRHDEQWNIRSGLGYSKTYKKHRLDLAIGAGASSTSSLRPNSSTIYGYNTTASTITPIYLPSPDPNAAISNYNVLLNNSFAGSVYPSTLLRPINGDTTRNRNLNGNAALTYHYADRFTVAGNYNTVFSPLYGQSSSYSVLSTSGISGEALLFKKIAGLFKNITLKTGIDRFKLPDLPAAYSNIRYQQTLWDNYAIWVNGLQPTQQKGQSSTNWYQRLAFSMLDSTLSFHVAYNTQTNRGNLNNLSTTAAALDNSSLSTTVLHYISAGLSGQLRHGLLRFQGEYAKSPEGQKTINGGGEYDIGHEKFFHSKTINLFNIGFKVETISPYQGLGLVMGTNVANNGSFSQAINNSFSLLPPNNKNFEIYTRMGLNDDAYSFDLRYYQRQTSGLNNFTATLTDPTTGTNAKVTYSTITNKGVEAFFKVRVIKTPVFSYEVTLNGAYNLNIAKNVPDPVFYGSVDYTTMYRNGYDVSSLWSVRSAGLNNQGDPQIYNKDGQVTAKLDSSTIAKSVVYSGKTRAPWTGGFIHDIRYKSLFARTSLVFNLGHVMRTYIPYPSSNTNENSILITDRWQKPGDERYTDVPRIDINNASNTSFRAFVVQNGTNSIVSADNVRLQEVMIGCYLPPSMLKHIGMSACTIALTAQNLYVWTRNPYHVDPITVDAAGRIGLPIPKQYSLNINVSF
ncbi:hypothetical protein CKK33_02015 [Mucilaginibacter sp. MD40]|uniref:SusC/RagA family TonB-linked outer membrane protein n=1 Tax=Mucilaginibacter sp. MD40 TaxID=2029590 RepID=UPI000BACCC63|nr:SusC/RagA family TonB-linked outer membrane protein [Mucilaginibacter sp. MD40]PAW92332.1 hypothetical protein CKK33_02015 [Mucilaginibacter sp. MD40]